MEGGGSDIAPAAAGAGAPNQLVLLHRRHRACSASYARPCSRHPATQLAQPTPFHPPHHTWDAPHPATIRAHQHTLSTPLPHPATPYNPKWSAHNP